MNTNASQPYAGFWIRTAAMIIDILLYSLIFFGIEFFLGKNTIPSKMTGLVVILVFYIMCMMSKWQATPGKYLFKLQVQPQYQHDMTLYAALLRSLTISLPFLPMLALSFTSEVNGMTLKMQAILNEGLTHRELLRYIADIEKGSIILKLYGYSVIAFFMIAPVWYISPVFSKSKRAFHDKLAGTNVLHISR